MDFSSISQLIRDDQLMGNLMGTRQAGLNRGQRASFMALPFDASLETASRGNSVSDDFLELVALAQARAESKASSAPEDGAVSREMAKNIAEMKNFRLRSSLQPNSGPLESASADGPSAKIRRSNLEALISSGSFGNLSGQMRGGRPGRVVKALEAQELANNLRPGRNSVRPLKMLSAEEADQLAYGLFSPLRGGESSDLNWLSPDDEFWLDDPLKQPYKTRSDWPDGLPPMASGQEKQEAGSSAESDILKAQRRDAAAAGKGGLSRDDLDRLVNKVALALDMDPALVKAVIKTESNFDHKAVSPAGAKGLMQLMPGTAKDLGVKDPFNPVENIWAGARYLKQMLERHGGNLNHALASYNWGPGNFDRKGKANMPGETRRYISTVNRHYDKFKKESTSRA